MTAYISLVFALVGAVVYVLASQSKVAELARLAYFAGLLAFLLGVAGHSVKFLS